MPPMPPGVALVGTDGFYGWRFVARTREDSLHDSLLSYQALSIL